MEADIKFMKGSQDRFLGDTSSKWDLYIFFINKLSAAGEIGFKTQVQIGWAWLVSWGD